MAINYRSTHDVSKINFLDVSRAGDMLVRVRREHVDTLVRGIEEFGGFFKALDRSYARSLRGSWDSQMDEALHDILRTGGSTTKGPDPIGIPDSMTSALYNSSMLLRSFDDTHVAIYEEMEKSTKRGNGERYPEAIAIVNQAMVLVYGGVIRATIEVTEMIAKAESGDGILRMYRAEFKATQAALGALIATKDYISRIDSVQIASFGSGARLLKRVQRKLRHEG